MTHALVMLYGALTTLIGSRYAYGIYNSRITNTSDSNTDVLQLNPEKETEMKLTDALNAASEVYASTEAALAKAKANMESAQAAVTAALPHISLLDKISSTVAASEATEATVKNSVGTLVQEIKAMFNY